MLMNMATSQRFWTITVNTSYYVLNIVLIRPILDKHPTNYGITKSPKSHNLEFLDANTLC